MQKKERDYLINRLESFVPQAKARAAEIIATTIAKGERPTVDYVYMAVNLEMQIENLIRDLKHGDLRC